MAEKLTDFVVQEYSVIVVDLIQIHQLDSFFVSGCSFEKFSGGLTGIEYRVLRP